MRGFGCGCWLWGGLIIGARRRGGWARRGANDAVGGGQYSGRRIFGGHPAANSASVKRERTRLASSTGQWICGLMEVGVLAAQCTGVTGAHGRIRPEDKQ